MTYIRFPHVTILVFTKEWSMVELVLIQRFPQALAKKGCGRYSAIRMPTALESRVNFKEVF